MAREIKVKNIYGSNVDLRPSLSIDLSTFPPCRRVHAQHIKRVNFQVCIWRRALDNFPEIPYSVTEYLHVHKYCSLSWFLSNVFPSLSVAFSRLIYRCLRKYLYVVLCIFGISFHEDLHHLCVLLFCSIRLSDTHLVC